MMANLFTLPEYRRCGYARLVLSALSKKLLSVGLVPYACVIEGNAATMRLFKECGFESCDSNITFDFYKPVIEK
jgi:predicted GNAT family acetyltransferase